MAAENALSTQADENPPHILKVKKIIKAEDVQKKAHEKKKLVQVSNVYNNRPVLSNQRMMNFYNNRVRRISLVND